ncbi:MAG: hypothetical protein C0501_24580 [Isosphaera sp.]|nr:hypothetical protein [Isosphaera sp.]
MARVYPRVLFAWAVCATAALAGRGDPTPEQLKEGERVFRDVYGKEYDRVTKGGKATPAEKVGLGKRLWEAAREAKDDPGLERVLADKALPLALEHPTGYPVALEIRTARVTDGRDRPEQLAAVAAVLEKMARADGTEKRAALAQSAVDLYREASDLEVDAGRPADAAGYAAKAKAAAQALLPPGQAAAVARDINAAQAEADALRRHAAEMAKLREAVKAKPDDPRQNQLLALALLRAGREGEAEKPLSAAPGKLSALAGQLARTPPDHARVGNLYRELADDHPADRAVLLGLARRHYETALGLDPKHPDAARLRLLVKELPAFRPAGPRVPADAAALIDENPAVVEAFSRGTGGTAKVEWAPRDGVGGGGCLKVTTGKPGVSDWRAFADEGLCKLTIDGSAEYRFAGFAYRQVGGTRAAFQFHSAAGPVGARLVAGPADGQEKGTPVADRPAEEWTVVTRDLFADNGGVAATVSGLAVETDGELYLDAVYLTRNQKQRDLRRVFAVLGVGPGKPKP